MDQYRQLRETGQRLVAEVIGKTKEEAQAICAHANFKMRFRSIDGRACMITADVQMDRIECRMKDNIITDASIG